jgi:hypothetical protein
MNITLLTNGINDLWYWTYGLVAGWGLSFTIVVVALVLIAIRLIRCEAHIRYLESRLVHAERDYNITLEKLRK